MVAVFAEVQSGFTWTPDMMDANQISEATLLLNLDSKYLD